MLAVRPPLALLILLLPLTGCLRLYARDVEPNYPDRGKDFQGNPYDHLASPQYSEGRISGFRELYVEADPFADKVTPSTGLPVQPVATVEPLTVPEGFAPVMLVRPDLTKLGEGRTFEDVARQAGAGRGLTLAMPTEALVALKAPADKRGQAQLIKLLEAAQVDGTPLKDLATFEVVDALPKAMFTGQPIESADQASLMLIAPTPPPPPPPPKKGTLPLDNITTSYAFITVNGEKVGQVPPLAKARIRDIKAGIYDVSWEVPNGFTWTEKLATRTDLDPRMSIDGDRIVLLENFYFQSGRASLQPRSLSLAKELAELMQDHPEILEVRVEGHTDSDGDANFNLDLSKRRAATVVNSLVQRGVESDRLVSQGLGEEKPVAPNDNAEGKALNRRVELHITKRESSAEKTSE
ncbi:MAG: OmpA family protein [Myxococcota bacterium]